VSQFAAWLSLTRWSLAIKVHEWVVPAVQSVHIVAIGVVLASAFMIDLRILGWAGRDQTLSETTARFGPWLTGALVILLVTGVVMVVGEPARELLAFSFWFKMCLVALATLVGLGFHVSLRRHTLQWETSLVHHRGIKSLAILTFLIWVCVVILGRLIAYDHVWGAWSMSPKA
jgi:hypothetical protein